MKLPEPSHPDARLWTTTELARFLGCTERHIFHLRDRGLPTIRLGSLVRFDAAEALNWIECQGKPTKRSSRVITPAARPSEVREGSEKFDLMAEGVQL